MFCAMCGAKLIDGSNFCSMCGSRVELPVKSEAASVNNVSEPKQNEIPDSEMDTTVLASPFQDVSPFQNIPQPDSSSNHKTGSNTQSASNSQNNSQPQYLPQPANHPQHEVLAQPGVAPVQPQPRPEVTVKTNKIGKGTKLAIISAAAAFALLVCVCFICGLIFYSGNANDKKMVYSTAVNDSGYIYYLKDYNKPGNAIKVAESDDFYFNIGNSFSKDGKYLYLYNYANDAKDYADLYRIPVNKLKKNKVNDKYLERIGSNISCYFVIDDGVVYLDDKDTLYIADKKNTEILRKNIYSFQFSEDEKIIYYVTKGAEESDKNHSIGYITLDDHESNDIAQQIDSNISICDDGYFVFSRVENFSDDNNCLSVYVADRTNGVVKIADNVNFVYGMDCNTHKVFYTRYQEKKIPYKDLIRIINEDDFSEADIEFMNDYDYSMNSYTLYASGVAELEQTLAENVTYVEVDEESGFITYMKKPETIEKIRSDEIDSLSISSSIDAAFEDSSEFCCRFGTGDEQPLDIRYDSRFVLDRDGKNIMVAFRQNSKKSLYQFIKSGETAIKIDRLGGPYDELDGTYLNGDFWYIARNGEDSALYKYDGNESQTMMVNVDSNVIMPNKSEFLCKSGGEYGVFSNKGLKKDSISSGQLKNCTYINKNNIIYSEDIGAAGYKVNLYKGHDRTKTIVESAGYYDTYIYQYKLKDEVRSIRHD